MTIDILIAIIIILIAMVFIQIGVLITLKKVITRLTALTKILPTSKNIMSASKKVLNKPLKTCKNCQFRLSFINMHSNNDIMFSYHCKVNDSTIKLDDSCSKFQFEHSKTN